MAWPSLTERPIALRVNFSTQAWSVRPDLACHKSTTATAPSVSSDSRKASSKPTVRIHACHCSGSVMPYAAINHTSTRSARRGSRASTFHSRRATSASPSSLGGYCSSKACRSRKDSNPRRGRACLQKYCTAVMRCGHAGGVCSAESITSNTSCAAPSPDSWADCDGGNSNNAVSSRSNGSGAKESSGALLHKPEASRDNPNPNNRATPQQAQAPLPGAQVV